MSGQSWSIDEIVYLCRAYPDTGISMAEIEANLRAHGAYRSLDSIHAKARSLDIQRPNCGKFDGTTGKPYAPGSNHKPTPVRDCVVKHMAEHGRIEIAEFARVNRFRYASVWKALKHLERQGNAHQDGKFWAIGPTKSGGGVKNPRRPRKARPVEDINELQPLHRPPLGLWGLVWTTTTPAEKGATAP